MVQDSLKNLSLNVWRASVNVVYNISSSQSVQCQRFHMQFSGPVCDAGFGFIVVEAGFCVGMQ